MEDKIDLFLQVCPSPTPFSELFEYFFMGIRMNNSDATIILNLCMEGQNIFILAVLAAPFVRYFLHIYEN